MDSNKKMYSDLGSPRPIKVEVKEENEMGNEYLMAKGRFQGVLKRLREQSDSDTDESSSEHNSYRRYQSPRKKIESVAPVRSTYLMKLYDRSVDLAKFEEDTPLYPICRAWIANNNKNPQTVIKRRLSSPEPMTWQNSVVTEVNRLPPPSAPFISRVPSPIPEQGNKDDIDLNYEDKILMTKPQLLKEHLMRWNKIKQKWIKTSAKNEERYTLSKHVLQNIYSKAQEAMLD